MAVFSKRNKCGQWWSIIDSITNNKLYNSKPSWGHRRADNEQQLGIEHVQSKLQDNKSGCGFSVYSNLQRSGGFKSNCDSKTHRGHKRNRHNKYLYPVVLCLTQLATVPATLAADVGGVSATANPIANSSGSVTNQAIQVLQGPYITNQYGGGIACQGPTANITPFITHARNEKDPFETYYYEPQYDNRDFEGQMVETQKNVKNWPWESWYDDRTYTNSDGETVRAFEDGQDMTITT